MFPEQPRFWDSSGAWSRAPLTGKHMPYGPLPMLPAPGAVQLDLFCSTPLDWGQAPGRPALHPSCQLCTHSPGPHRPGEPTWQR